MAAFRIVLVLALLLSAAGRASADAAMVSLLSTAVPVAASVPLLLYDRAEGLIPLGVGLVLGPSMGRFFGGDAVKGFYQARQRAGIAALGAVGFVAFVAVGLSSSCKDGGPGCRDGSGSWSTAAYVTAGLAGAGLLAHGAFDIAGQRAVVAPTVVAGAPGLAIAGRF
jgi:hypothetical protein